MIHGFLAELSVRHLECGQRYCSQVVLMRSLWDVNDTAVVCDTGSACYFHVVGHVTFTAATDKSLSRKLN